MSPLVKLEHLDLSNNYFKTVKENTFLSMGNLEVLELNDNEITMIERGTFQVRLKYKNFDSYLKYGILYFIHANRKLTTRV